MKLIEKQVEEYLWYCENVRRMSAVTVGAKRSVLERFTRVTGVTDLRAADERAFEKWVAWNLAREVKAGSANTYNSVVMGLVRYFQERGEAVRTPMALKRKIKGPATARKFYSAEEVELVVARADEVTALQITIMFETGLRIAELCALKWTDFEGRRVRFVGKGRKLREVYVTEKTLARVREYVAKYDAYGFLWCVRNGVRLEGDRPVGVNTTREQLKRAFAAAGFEDFYPHALRHSFATDLQMKGASVAEIKEMIGHENIATTERYLHGFEGRLGELFDKYR